MNFVMTTIEEESALTLDDVFLDLNVDQMNTILDLFFIKFSVDNDWDSNDTQMNECIVDNQDTLERVRDNFLQS